MPVHFTLGVFVGLLVLLAVPGALATTYYVSSSSGSDTNAGTSSTAPLKSLTAVNKLINDNTLAAGYSVLFKRGDKWVGTILSPPAGSKGKILTFGAYGSASDDLPLLTGLLPVTGWTAATLPYAPSTNLCVNDMSAFWDNLCTWEGGSWWLAEDVVAGKHQLWPRVLMVNGEHGLRARLPEKDHYFYLDADYTAVGGDAVLPCAELANVANRDKLIGSTLVLRNIQWMYVSCTVVGISASSVTCDKGIVDGLSTRNGFFFQNTTLGLSEPGEYWIDNANKKAYMVISAGSSCSSLDTAVEVPVFQEGLNGMPGYTALDHIHFHGYDSDIVQIKNGDHQSITNCNFSLSTAALFSVVGEGLTITGNSVLKMSMSGFGWWIDKGTGTVISDNVLRDIGLDPGIVLGSGGSAISFGGSGSNGNLITHNYIDRVGYNGIIVTGGVIGGANPNIISKNFVSRVHQTITDGGSIYLEKTVGILIENNILVDGGDCGNYQGNGKCANKASWFGGLGWEEQESYTFGVSMMEDGNRDIVIRNNTIINHGRALHSAGLAQNVTWEFNTLYASRDVDMLWDLGSNAVNGVNYGLSVKHNIFVVTQPNVLPMFDNSETSTPMNYGERGYNYYLSPYSDSRMAGLYDIWNPTRVGMIHWQRFAVSPWAAYDTFETLAYMSGMSVKDTHSYTDLVKWPVYRDGPAGTLQDVDQKIGSNLLDDVTATWRCNGCTAATSTSASIFGGKQALKVDSTSDYSHLHTPGITTVTNGTIYLLTLRIYSPTRNAGLVVALREWTNPYADEPVVSPEFIIMSSQTPSTGVLYQIPFKVTAASADQLTRVQFTIRNYLTGSESLTTYYITDLSLYQITLKEATDPTLRARIYYNWDSSPATYGLGSDARFTNIDGVELTGSIVVPAYGSVVVLRDIPSTVVARVPLWTRPSEQGGTPSSCTPTCGTHNCGQWDDGCGSQITCGTCESGMTCTASSGVCSCPVPTCTSTSCGTIKNECGNTASCSATCPSDQSCSLISGECYTPPSNCVKATCGSQCGVIPDNCGGGLNCGDCSNVDGPSSKGLSGGAVAGIVIGILGGVGLAGAAVGGVWWYRRKYKNRYTQGGSWSSPLLQGPLG